MHIAAHPARSGFWGFSRFSRFSRIWRAKARSAPLWLLFIAMLGLMPITAPGAQGTQGAPSLTIALISPRGVEQTRTDWSPFIDDLSRALKTPVTLRIGKSPKDVSNDMLERRADLAWLGNSPALEVVEAGAGEVFAAMVRIDGSTGYKSILITHAKSPLKSVDDMLKAAKNLTFAAGDPKSTSGYVVPNYYVFARNKVQPEQAFKKIITGNHQENALRVARGEADVGTCNDSELAAFRLRTPADAANLRVLWESKEIPESPMLWQKNLPAPMKAKLQQFFTEYGAKSAQEQENLKRINGLKRFRPSSNRQLLAIADIEMFNARTQIDRDPKLTLEERGAKHQDIVKRAVRLETALRQKN